MFKSLLLSVSLIIPAVSMAQTSNYAYSVEEISSLLNNSVVKKKISAKGKAMVTSVAKDGMIFTIGTNNGCVSSFGVMYTGLPMPGGPVHMDVKHLETNCLPSGGAVGH